MWINNVQFIFPSQINEIVKKTMIKLCFVALYAYRFAKNEIISKSTPNKQHKRKTERIKIRILKFFSTSKLKILSKW